jgi:hypothetical protein
MAVVFTGPGGRVTISPPGLIRKIATLPDTIRKVVVRKALLELGTRQKNLVATGLRSGSFALAKLAPTTILARQVGKKTGLTPARPKSRSINPLYYTGTTIAGVSVKIVGESLVVVGPSFDQIPYSGTPAILAATYQELGFRTRGKYSRKMLAYLHILFRKDDERGSRAKEDSARKSKKGGARVGTGFSRNVPARPVWELSRQRVGKEAPAVFREHIKTALVASGLTVT